MRNLSDDSSAVSFWQMELQVYKWSLTRVAYLCFRQRMIDNFEFHRTLMHQNAQKRHFSCFPTIIARRRRANCQKEHVWVKWPRNMPKCGPSVRMTIRPSTKKCPTHTRRSTSWRCKSTTWTKSRRVFDSLLSCASTFANHILQHNSPMKNISRTSVTHRSNWNKALDLIVVAYGNIKHSILLILKVNFVIS